MAVLSLIIYSLEKAILWDNEEVPPYDSHNSLVSGI